MGVLMEGLSSVQVVGGVGDGEGVLICCVVMGFYI